MASFGGFGAPPAAGEEGKSPFAGFTLAPPTAAAGEEGKPPAPFGGGFAAPAAPASFGAPAAGAESAGAATAEGEGDGDGEGVPAPEEESTAEFTPLVHLDEVRRGSSDRHMHRDFHGQPTPLTRLRHLHVIAGGSQNARGGGVGRL